MLFDGCSCCCCCCMFIVQSDFFSTTFYPIRLLDDWWKQTTEFRLCRSVCGHFMNNLNAREQQHERIPSHINNKNCSICWFERFRRKLHFSKHSRFACFRWFFIVFASTLERFTWTYSFGGRSTYIQTFHSSRWLWIFNSAFSLISSGGWRNIAKAVSLW